MRAEHLRYILEIDKEHSISAAAQKLYLGQTTLSTILKGVEDELGFAIFERTRTGVHITPDGEEALSLIREISDSYEDVQRLTHSHASNSQPVNLLVSPSIHCGLAIEVSKRLLKIAPDVNLRFHVLSGEYIGPKIIKSDANIGVTYYDNNVYRAYSMVLSKYQTKAVKIMDEEMYVIVRCDSPFAKRDSVSINELNKVKVAFLPHYNISASALTAEIIQGKDNIYTTYPDVPTIKRAVLSQNCISVLSGYAIKSCTGTGISSDMFKAIPITGTSGSAGFSMYLMHRDSTYLHYHEKIALKCIEDYFEELTGKKLDGWDE